MDDVCSRFARALGFLPLFLLAPESAVWASRTRCCLFRGCELRSLAQTEGRGHTVREFK